MKVFSLVIHTIVMLTGFVLVLGGVGLFVVSMFARSGLLPGIAYWAVRAVLMVLSGFIGYWRDSKELRVKIANKTW